MKTLPLSIAFIALVAIAFLACKKEEVDNQQFVKNNFIGKWPLKKSITITTKNGTITANDTTYFGLSAPNVVFPVDTVLFTIDDKCIKNGLNLAYAINKTGDSISYSNTALGAWNIKYLRTNSIILTQEKTEKKDSDTFISYKEEQLIK